MFTQKCFIRKNTPELVKNLEEMGYNVVSFGVINIFNEKPYLLSDTNGGIYGMYDIEKGCIDCETNDELFLAIAALRDDTDKNQWFVHDDSDWNDKQNIFWYKCEEDSIIEDLAYNLMFNDCHKATVQELIEHFNP